MKNYKILKLHRGTILFFLTALLFFQPARYVLGETPSRIWNYVLLLVGMAYSAVYVTKFRFTQPRKSDVGAFVLLLAHIYCLFFASFLNPEVSDFRGGLIYAVLMIGFVMFALVGMNYAPRQFFAGYTAAGFIMSFIHLVTILMYQDTGGMRKGISTSLGRSFSENWFFFGHANAAFYVVFPLIVMLFVYAYHFNRRMLKYACAFMAFTLFCFTVQWTLAGLLGCVAYCGLLVLDCLPGARSSKLIRAILNLRLIMIITLIGESFLGLFSGLSRYTDFLLEYFGKGQSISARLDIWSRVMPYILQKPIFGNGWNYEEIMVNRITRGHTHNILIEFLYCGGIVSVLLFVFAIEYLQRQIDASGGRFYNSKAARVATYAAIPYVLAGTFDYYMYRYHSLILYMALWYLLAESKKEPEKKIGSQGPDTPEIFARGDHE